MKDDIKLKIFGKERKIFNQKISKYPRDYFLIADLFK